MADSSYAQRITITLPAEIQEFLEQRADETGESKSAIIASALVELRDRIRKEKIDRLNLF